MEEELDQAQANIVELRRDRDSVQSQLEIGERVTLIAFPDMRGSVRASEGDGGVVIKWDNGTTGYHCLIDLACECCFEDRQLAKESGEAN